MTLSPTCWACGLAPDASVQQSVLRDLEPTSRPPVSVKAETLTDLMTVQNTKSAESGEPLTRACVTCGAEMFNTTTCPACGACHEPHSYAPEPEAQAIRPCPYCGVKNPLRRSVCMNCASLLGEASHAV